VTQESRLGDIGSETRLEPDNMAFILETSGSTLASVVKVSIHLANLDDFDGMTEGRVFLREKRETLRLRFGANEE
jgi:enamine deaminase RidA (YjgF/YER057c/UK114 family)